MPIKIISIIPEAILPTDASPEAEIIAHKNIQNFEWVNEQTQKKGIANREVLYNWIVNQKGKAYLINTEKEMVYLFGASTSTGEHYVRAAKNGKWSNDLFRIFHG